MKKQRERCDTDALLRHIGPMTVRLRSAIRSDLDAVLSLLRELDESHVDLEPALLKTFSEPPRPRDWMLARFVEPGEACFVAEQEGQVVGFIWAKVQNPPAIPAFVQEPLLVVADLVVHAPYRKRGIGHALLEHAINFGKVRGARRVQLTVFDKNGSARKFYDDLGFRPLSVVLTKEL